MPKIEAQHLTEQQKKWFASVRDGLESETGRSLPEWVAIAQTCPETAPRARLKWFKENHGLLQNRASYVLSEAFPTSGGWSEPETLREVLWADHGQRVIFDAVETAVKTLPGIVVGQRKGYSAWSRNFQFAAVKPVRGGARLGLAVAPDADPRLQAYKPSDGWSERLRGAMSLTSPKDVDATIYALLEAAWERS